MFESESQNDFEKAVNKSRLDSLISLIRWENPRLLSLYDVTKLVKPRTETYIGFKSIEIKKIIGSEGRFYDFSKAFFPKKKMLKGRWTSIDRANRQSIILPPISVYQLGDNYFVRDGNHRVSVAKMMRIEFIDAEIVKLDSQIELKPGMTMRSIQKKVVEYERNCVLKEYPSLKELPIDKIRFTETGLYAEIVQHILVHKYYMNLHKDEEIPFKEGALNWYKTVYLPIVKEIREQKLMTFFPGKTESDLYMYLVKHWHYMKTNSKNNNISIHSASEDYKQKSREGALKRWIIFLKEKFSRKN